ncbi:hypothetical protein [Marinomonas spartinae]|uniref:hypothetical protein n=1 Tax=Marinomonas spartinae TaxID=1792290 RepID=UPI0018F1A16D|nr:hypothetical protein [Marinomonas spartinae]MBJ7556546.1 hypothetical protein [Marinomonas spartinae]
MDFFAEMEKAIQRAELEMKREMLKEMLAQELITLEKLSAEDRLLLKEGLPQEEGN